MREGLRLQGKLLDDFLVSLENLDGVPSLHFIVHIVDNGLFDVGQCVFHGTRECVHRDFFSALCGSNRGLSCFLDSCPFQGRYLDDLTSELFGQLCGVQLVTGLPDKVHHVDGNYNGDAQFYQLGGQIKVSLEVGSVHDVQDGIGSLAYQIVSGYYFLEGIG